VSASTSVALNVIQPANMWPLRGHQRERLLVGVEHHHAGRELHLARQRHVQQRDLAGRDPGQRPVEAVALGPELGEALLPGRDQLGRGDALARAGAPGRSSATSSRSPGSGPRGACPRR
jgi:hypothetical protein